MSENDSLLENTGNAKGHRQISPAECRFNCGWADNGSDTSLKTRGKFGEVYQWNVLQQKSGYTNQTLFGALEIAMLFDRLSSRLWAFGSVKVLYSTI